MLKTKKIEFIEYILETVRLEMMASIDNTEFDNDTLIEELIKKLIERRMKDCPIDCKTIQYYKGN